MGIDHRHHHRYEDTTPGSREVRGRWCHADRPRDPRPTLGNCDSDGGTDGGDGDDGDDDNDGDDGNGGNDDGDDGDDSYGDNVEIPRLSLNSDAFEAFP